MFYEVLFEGLLEWSIPWLAGLISLTVIYIYLVMCYTNWKRNYKQSLLFFLCIALTYLTIGSPLAPISHFSFSLHMIQMSIIYFIIPPLFLLSIPAQLFYKIVRIPSLISKTSKFLLSPTTALYTFAGLFLMYHLPAILNFLSQFPIVHMVYEIFLFGLTLLMWWPIAASDPEQRLAKKQMKRYVLMSGFVLMPACLLFIANGFMNGMDNPFVNEMTATLCIPASADSIEILPPPFNTKYDQIAAGVFMMGMHKFGLMLAVKLVSR